MSILLLSLLACADPAQSDAEVYAELISAPSPDPAVDLPRCAAIADDFTSGDCALVVARSAARARGEAPETYCEAIPLGQWRGECWFLAAEDANAAKNVQKAAELCGLSRPFVNDCAWHLWQNDLIKLLGPRQRRDAVGSLDDARTLYDAWNTVVGAESDFELRFWRRYYEMAFEARPGVDTTWCDPLPAVDRVRCRYSVAHVYMRRVLDFAQKPEGAAILCSLVDPTPTLVAPRMPLGDANDDPLLQQVLDEQVERACVTHDRSPMETGVTTPASWRAAAAAAEQGQPVPYDPAPTGPAPTDPAPSP